MSVIDIAGFISALPIILPKDNDGYYLGIIKEIYPKERNLKNTFYKLNGILPTSELPNALSYVENESHWLAIWNNKYNGKNFILSEGDEVRFKIGKVDILNDYGHVYNARNITVKAFK